MGHANSNLALVWQACRLVSKGEACDSLFFVDARAYHVCTCMRCMHVSLCCMPMHVVCGLSVVLCTLESSPGQRADF